MGTQQPRDQDGEALGARSPACFWLSLVSGIVFAAGLTAMDSSHLGTWGWHFNSGLVGREPGTVALIASVPGGPELFTHLCIGHRFSLSGAFPPSFLSLSPFHPSPSIYASQHCFEHLLGPGQASGIAKLNLNLVPAPRGSHAPRGETRVRCSPSNCEHICTALWEGDPASGGGDQTSPYGMGVRGLVPCALDTKLLRLSP